MKALPRFMVLSLALATTAACSTRPQNASSEKNNIVPLNETDSHADSWIKACQADLADGTTGADSRAYLMQLAQTDDCAEAYKTIKMIFGQFTAEAKNLQN